MACQLSYARWPIAEWCISPPTTSPKNHRRSFVQIVTKDQPGAHSHAPAGGQTESGICFGSAGPKGSTAEYDTF